MSARHVLAGRQVTHSAIRPPSRVQYAVLRRYVDCVNGASKSCSKSAATQSTTLIQHGRMHQVTYGY